MVEDEEEKKRVATKLKSGTMAKDFFNRRRENAFMHTSDKNKIFNWDMGRKNLSSYFMGSSKNPLSDAATFIGSMFKVIGTKKNPKYTPDAPKNSDEIQVPVQILKDKDGKYDTSNPEMMDIFYGASLQNAAMQAYQASSEYNKHIQKYNKGATLHDLLFTVLNTERIDSKLAERRPGYAKFVQKFKNFTFEKGYKPLPEDAPAQHKLADLIVRMLRYPANITDEELTQFAEPIKQMERLLKKYGGIPETSEECSSMAQSLANIIYKFTETPPPSEDEEEEGGGGTGKSMDKAEVDAIAKSLMDTMKGGIGASDKGDKETLEECQEDIDGKHPETDREFNYEEYFDENERRTIFQEAKDNRDQYNRDLANIDVVKAAVLRRLFERKNKDYAFVIKSMKTGRFDTNKLVEAVQGVETIYERIGTVKTNKICVGVLIDESGSMGGGGRIEKARQAAIFINEVFGKMPNAELFIYGHTADQEDDETSIYVYREPNKRIGRYALGSARSRSNNRDGAAILECAKRMRKNTKNEGLFFVLSDGAPAASGYGGGGGVKDTREKVKRAEKLGFQVIQIAIDESVPSEQMFTHFMKMTNIKNLPNDMIAYMSRKVDKLIKSTISQ